MRWKRLIVDGNNQAHVYRHVHGDLCTHKGIPTGVIYGFMNMLGRMIDSFNPDELIVAWDCEGKSARAMSSPSYKSARKKKHAELDVTEAQRLKLFYDVELPMLHDLLYNLGIPQIQMKLLEADDIIALSVQSKEDTGEWIVVSNDRDYVQWVSRGKCRLYSPSSDSLFFQEIDLSVQGGKTEFGHFVPSPETYAIWRAMIGDKSDSIPGIAGIGAGTVWSMFHEACPATDADSKEAVLKYLRSANDERVTSRRAGYIREIVEEDGEARKKFFDTLRLMRATPENVEALLAYVKKEYSVSSKRTNSFIRRSKGEAGGIIDIPNSLLLPDSPKYLSGNNKDPNPFVMFLRKLEFDMGYYKGSWLPWIRKFSHLHEHRKGWRKYTPWSPVENHTPLTSS